MFLQHLGPAILPKELAFEEFCCTPNSTKAFLQREISKVAAASPAVNSLIFVENNPLQLEGLKQNILSFQRMLKEHAIAGPEFVSAGDDFFSFEMEQLKSADLFTLLNPPWGERLGEKNSSPNLFKRIGERLRHIAKSGSYGAIISPSPQCSKAFLSGSKASFHKSLNVSSGGKPVIATAFRL